MIKRNDNIDFFRGVAAVWIIFIHTFFGVVQCMFLLGYNLYR